MEIVKHYSEYFAMLADAKGRMLPIVIGHHGEFRWLGRPSPTGRPMMQPVCAHTLAWWYLGLVSSRRRHYPDGCPTPTSWTSQSQPHWTGLGVDPSAQSVVGGAILEPVLRPRTSTRYVESARGSLAGVDADSWVIEAVCVMRQWRSWTCPDRQFIARYQTEEEARAAYPIIRDHLAWYLGDTAAPAPPDAQEAP